MKLETALKKPRTVTELMKLTELSRGGVLSGLKRLKAKNVGSKRTAKQGRAAELWKGRATKASDTAPRPTPGDDANGSPVAETPAQTEQTALNAFEQAVVANAIQPTLAETLADSIVDAIATGVQTPESEQS